jgi:hypothetical protein
LGLLFADISGFIKRYLKEEGGQFFEQGPSRDFARDLCLGFMQIQLGGYAMAKHDDVLSIIDPDYLVTKTSKQSAVESAEACAPRIEYCRPSTGKMFGSEKWQLTKQIFTVSLK